MVTLYKNTIWFKSVSGIINHSGPKSIKDVFEYFIKFSKIAINKAVDYNQRGFKQ